jgi:hypothetical protein
MKFLVCAMYTWDLAPARRAITIRLSGAEPGRVSVVITGPA